MKTKFWLLHRNGIFYIQDSTTLRKSSLHTRNRREAQRLRTAYNKTAQNSVQGMAFAKAYLSAHDPDFAIRTWQHVMDFFCDRGTPQTQAHRKRIVNYSHFDRIRSKKLLETTADDFLRILKVGGVMVHVNLRCLQSLALGTNCLPWPILPNKLCPLLNTKPKHGVTAMEHQKIVSTETNVEKRHYYELLWEIGASQSDAALLCAENIEWKSRLLSYQRRKTGVLCYIRIGSRLEGILRQLPDQEMLFPRLGKTTAGSRAAEFHRRCRTLKMEGISLHSYRYAWAERARTVGYPERFAQEALGHKSKAVHRAYAKKAHVILPSLEEYERSNQPLLPLFAAESKISAASVWSCPT